MPTTSPLPVRDKVPVIAQCETLCEQSLALLDTPGCLGSEEIVHQLRVATKRLRAAWHLVKATDPELAKTRRAALRGLSAVIAGQRDRDVLLGLAAELATESGQHDAFAGLLDSLAVSPQPSPHISAPVNSIREIWAAELSAWRELEPPLADSTQRRKIFRYALRTSERRAVQLTRKALAADKADAELWHDWRKAVKRLRYQREFIAAAQGRQLATRDGRLSRLGTRLGERNDLANLIEAVENLPDITRQQHAQIRKAIAQRERRVMSSARRLGRLAFLR